MEKPRRTKKKGETLQVISQPEQKKAAIHIPIRVAQGTALLLCVLILVLAGAFWHYRQTTQNAARAETIQLENLQQNDDAQTQEIEQLAKTISTLQADLQRLDSLDVEIRKIVNNDNTTTTSRAGLVRPSGNYTGQGGPEVQPPEMSNISDMIQVANDLQSKVKIREQSLVELKQEVLARQARLAATPSIWPVNGEVTSRFGWRTSPWGSGTGGESDSDFHPGIDIANDAGTAIFATADGEVVTAGSSGGYGNLVQIDHGNGISTLYGHNSQIIVKVGQVVKKGQIISYMGSTGNSTGPHCHYEIRVNGTAVDPTSFLVLK